MLLFSCFDLRFWIREIGVCGKNIPQPAALKPDGQHIIADQTQHLHLCSPIDLGLVVVQRHICFGVDRRKGGSGLNRRDSIISVIALAFDGQKIALHPAGSAIYFHLYPFTVLCKAKHNAFAAIIVFAKALAFGGWLRAQVKPVGFVGVADVNLHTMPGA